MSLSTHGLDWIPLVSCFLSHIQYRTENENFISNFVFQFIKKRNGTLVTRINLFFGLL